MSIFFFKKRSKKIFFPSNELLLDQCHKHLHQLPALLRMYLDVAVITQQMLYFFQVLLVSAAQFRVLLFRNLVFLSVHTTERYCNPMSPSKIIIHTIARFENGTSRQGAIRWEAFSLETVQNFLIKLGIKPHLHLWEMSISSLNNDIIRPMKIMNRADKNWADF